MSDILPLVLLVLLKVAYLATGLTLSIVGKRLIDKKLTTKFEGEGSLARTSFKLATTSPGLVFLAAGLIVIGAAIFQQSQIQEAYRQAVPAAAERPALPPAVADHPSALPAASTPPDPRDAEPKQSLQMLVVERVKTISFASDGQGSHTIEEELRQARRLAAEGRIEEAAVHLSVAVVAAPATLVAVTSDPAYEAVLQQSQFDTIARARLQLPLHTMNVPAAVLSPVAEQLMSRLRTWAKLRGPQDTQAPDAAALARALPATSGAEPKEQTLRTLVGLIDRSPDLLAQELGRAERRWILDDPEILRVLERDIDRRIRND